MEGVLSAMVGLVKLCEVQGGQKIGTLDIWLHLNCQMLG